MLVSSLLRAASSAQHLALKARDSLCGLKLFPLHRPPGWTVSFGSLTDSPTGKSAAVLLAAEALAERGTRTCVLCDADSRYLSKAMRRNDVPIFSANTHRAALERALESSDPQVFLLDDAFGARSLARDVDVVVVDAAAPFGDGALWPAGTLREPPSALGRADLILLTNADAPEAEALAALRAELSRHAPRAPVVEASFSVDSIVDLRLGARLSSRQLEGRKAAFFTCAARGSAFKSQMLKAGIKPSRGWRFRAGHRYSPCDLRHIEAAAEGLPLVTSLKDVSLLPETWRSHFTGEVYALASRLEIGRGTESWARMVTFRPAPP